MQDCFYNSGATAETGARNIYDFDNDMCDCFYAFFDCEKKALEEIAPNLTFREFHVIETILKLQKTNSNTLSIAATRLGITLGSMTTAVSKLEQKGYLIKERYIIDQRVHFITPTQKAIEASARHSAWHEGLVKELSRTFPQRDMDTIAAIFRDLTHFFRYI